jgi:sulfite reductase alpha subunit-like flavoprotein
LEEYPLPEGQSPIPDNVLLEPKWILDYGDGCENELRVVGNGRNGEMSSSTTPPEDLLQIANGITATLASNNRLTPIAHWQDVRHLTFTLSEPKLYGPGDVLTIYSKNFPVDVDQFLQLMDWISIADIPLKFIPTSTEELTPSYPTPPIPPLPHGATLTLRSLLTNYLDIMSIPRRSFFNHLTHYTEDPFHIERLQEFTNPEYIDELYDYTTRPRRSILEVLDEFTSVKIPWQRICSVIPLLRGRQFSIASGGSLKTEPSSEHSTKVELLVAIVKYKTIMKRIRQGVCTRYIASLEPGQKITVTLQKGGLGARKTDLEKPVVMICPGTGVAPARSLIHERMQWRHEAGLQQRDHNGIADTLFFGCRNAEQDYFFKDEWQNLTSTIGLNIFAAFSRDQVCSFTYFEEDSLIDVPAKKSLRARFNTRAIQTRLHRPCRNWRYGLYLRVVGENATGSTGSTYRSVSKAW